MANSDTNAQTTTHTEIMQRRFGLDTWIRLRRFIGRHIGNGSEPGFTTSLNCGSSHVKGDLIVHYNEGAILFVLKNLKYLQKLVVGGDLTTP